VHFQGFTFYRSGRPCHAGKFNCHRCVTSVFRFSAISRELTLHLVKGENMFIRFLFQSLQWHNILEAGTTLRKLFIYEYHSSTREWKLICSLAPSIGIGPVVWRVVWATFILCWNKANIYANTVTIYRAPGHALITSLVHHADSILPIYDSVAQTSAVRSSSLETSSIFKISD
jgi:hypothetical protein